MSIGWKRVARVVLMLWLALSGALNAHAQCVTDSATPASFGTVTSFVVKSTQQHTSSTDAGVSCNGGTLVLLTTNTIDGIITSANNGNLVNSATGDRIAFSLYADSAHSTPLNFGTQYNWASTQLLNLLGLLGNGGSTPVPLYLQTSAGSNVAAGIYTDTLTVQWRWNICDAGVLVLCLAYSTGSGTSTIPVTLVVTNDCTITAPNVNFGSAASVAGFLPVTGSVSLTCTKGMSYTVGLSAGAQPAANGRRRMVSGSNYLQYDIYSGGAGAVWGDATNRVSSAGAADGVSSQHFPYTASIYTDQATPPVGTYTDSVVVDVRY